MKRLDPFGFQEFYIVSEDCEEGQEEWFTEWRTEVVLLKNWENWLDDVKHNMDEPLPKFKKEYCKLRNRDFERKYVIGQPYDDGASIVTDVECPECKHLLVDQDPEENAGRFCSSDDCKYVDQRAEAYEKEEATNSKGATMMLPGQDPKDYAEKIGLDFDKDNLKSCHCCGSENLKLSCYRTSNGYAGIESKCECGNSSSISVPVTEKALSFWKNIL